ncbi:AraC family transcriptional regulator [Chitinophaga sp.]|uniref:AraC family transcriptional regulator n=1 Tax=Chitinophaga sp. TaxID=1869181 RepID=UPI002BF6D7AD|nr:AraC family transcriptional regulator [Chitinophaga sp.]HWV66113.1 AraC family transcriptional regulator [Chitinophaga sp.]
MEGIPVRHINTAEIAPELSDSFHIRDVEGMLAGKDMIQELHRHDFFYLLALKKGQGTHEIDFTSYPVGDHSVFFIHPGQVHQLVLKAGSTGFLMQFHGAFYTSRDKASNKLLCKTSHINHYQFSAAKFQKLFALLTSIFQEYTAKQERHQEVMKASMYILFVELLRDNNNAAPRSNNLYVQERLDDFLSLLEAHIFEHKQVAEYAGMLNLSPYQLNAITKAALGKTCSEVINEHIILEAKRSLLATSDQVNQVAWRLGYEDVSYFIRFFKKRTGHSPEAFRHNFR